MRLLLRCVALLLCVCLLKGFPLHGQARSLDEVLAQAAAEQGAGRYPGAAALYARATALDPGEPELWSNRGVMEFLSGQIELSIASLKHAMELNPKLFAPWLFLGKDYLEAGKPRQALAYLNRAHALNSNDIEVLLALGKANLKLEQPRAAALFYADAAKAAPADTGAWLGLGVSSLQLIGVDGQLLATSEARSIWARSLYADELFVQGRPLEAADSYRAAFAEAPAPKKLVLVRNLAWLREHAELPAASQEAIAKLTAQLGAQAGPAVPCAPGKQPALDEAACAYSEGDYERTAEAADEALRQPPGSAEARFWSIKANERIAITAFSRFEELSPHSPANYVLVGNLYRLQDRAEEALSEYGKALAVDAHDPAALQGAVLASLSANKLDQAAAYARTALADRPDDPRLNLLMAEVLETAGRGEEAQPFLAKCGGAPPELQPRVHYLLGRIYARQDKTDQAIREFEQALPGDKDGSVHYQLARLYRKAGRPAEADKLSAQSKNLIAKRRANAVIEVREAGAAVQQGPE